MERPLRIFEMHEDADPVALAQSQLVPGLFPREYAATRARRAIDLRTARSDDTVLWAFTMLPISPLVSGVPPSLVLPVRLMSACFEALLVFFADKGHERRAVRPTHAPGPSARAWRSSGSRSGRRARRSGASGDGSAGSRGVRSSGCVSSRGSPHLGPRSTCRHARRRRRREAMGAGLPPRGGSLTPLAESRGGGGSVDGENPST
jgi:hypothetical protein